MVDISPSKVASPLPASSNTSTPVMSQNTIESTPSLKNSTKSTGGSGGGGSGNSLSKRIEVENLAKEFQKKLGNNWDKYQSTISAFLVGKLSRRELTTVLDELLSDSKMVRMHNQLLLANLANSLRDGPNSASANSGFGGVGSNKRKKDGRVKASSQYEKLKKDIMGLPIRERRRIKSVTRDSGKRSMANSALTLTRQNLLPKIPYVSDKDKTVTGNTVEWTQDISHGIQTLLSTETFSLPDNDNLKSRMLGIAREHGLTGTIDKNVVDLTYIGLENYLKGRIEQAIDTVRYRKQKYASDDILEASNPKENTRKRQRKVILTNEDMVDTFNLFPYLIEPSGPLYRLHGVQLNDDTYVEEKTAIDSILKPKAEVFKSPLIPKKHQSPLLQQKNADNSQRVDSNDSDKIKVENGDSNNQRTNGKIEESPQRDQPNNTSTPNKPAIPNGSANNELINSNVGTRDELNWLIYDILSTH